MKPIRIGVIGCGVIGTQHIRAGVAADNIEIAAVADLFTDKAKATATEFGVEHVFTEGAELIAATPDLDGVVFATITSARGQLAIDALNQGKHILVEKPVGMDAGEVEAMIAARGDLIAGCCSSRFRFPASAIAATEFIASGALGNLRTLHCRALIPAKPAPDTLPPGWRLNRALNGGGIMANWGCYDLDYLLGLCGWSLTPKIILAQTWTIPPRLTSHVPDNSDAETHLAAHIHCAEGAVLQIERGEYIPSPARAAWQIIGNDGSLTLDMANWDGGQSKLVHDELSAADGLVPHTIWEGEDDMGLIHSGPITDFAAAIREKRPPKTSLENVLVLQKITDGIYVSADSGIAIAIS